MAKRHRHTTKQHVLAMSSPFLALPTWLTGAARLFDFSGSMNAYPIDIPGETLDQLAIMADWRAVGIDMHQAMQDVLRTQRSKLHER
jgi:hypothetical protein